MPAIHQLSKSTYIRGTQCKKSLYLNKYHKELRDPIDDSTQAVFDSGHQVGELAQGLFPGGEDTRFYDDLDVPRAVFQTQQLINSGVNVIYEGAFMYEDCLSVIDILVNNGRGWNAYEVKSSTKVKKAHITDVSYQYHIMTKTGLELDDISLVYVNNKYIRNGELDLSELFIIKSLKEKALENQELIDEFVEDLKNTLRMDAVPEMGIGKHCTKPYKCDFHTNCWKDIPDGSVFELIGFQMNKKMELYERGIIKISDIPEDIELNVLQQIQVRSLKDNKPYVNKESISEFLSGLNYPLYFMDFETINPAIPIYDNTSPYRQIPFQYSLHLLNNRGDEPVHFEYLAENARDCRYDFVRSLIDDIKGTGNIIVYNKPFERKRLEELSVEFPQYKKEILAVINRLKDLMKPFKERSYYHHDMEGYYGLKTVLPSLIPELSYQNLSISNGGLAQISFLKLNDDGLSGEEKKKIREDLLEYCKLDTFALVKILDELYKLCA